MSVNTSPTSNSLTTTYPSADLETVYRRLLKVDATIIQGKSVDRATLRHSLGFGSDGGRSNSVISSLMHFGLLKRDDKFYFVTELARRMSTTEEGKEEWNGYAAEAATSPKLFWQLHAKFPTQLPGDIKNRLMRGYRIKADRVESVIKNYQKSLEFSGIIAPTDEQAENNKLEPSLFPQSEDIAALPPTPPGDLIAFPFPLSNNTVVTLNLPPRLTVDDAGRLSRFLETLVIQRGMEQ